MAAPMPVLHRIEGHDGVGLACFEWHRERQGQGPTVLMVHATGFHARVWDPVIRRLPAHHVLALELRGHGRSDAAAFSGWETFGRDVAAAAAALGLKSAVGVGHSMGAHALVQAAAYEPGRFAQLVLVDPVIRDPAEYHRPPPPPGRQPPAAGRRNRFESADAMIARFADRIPYARFDREALRAYCEHGLRPAADGDGFELCCAPAYEARVYATARQNAGVYASVRALDIPVLVLRVRPPDPDAAGFDPLASPTWPGLAGEFRRGEERVLPEHGHLLPMEDPARVAAIVAERLASTGAPR